jgi:hypothetical protein
LAKIAKSNLSSHFEADAPGKSVSLQELWTPAESAMREANLLIVGGGFGANVCVSA